MLRDQAWSTVQNGPQKSTIGEGLLGYLDESLITQRAQLHAMHDREWLLKQNARDLTMLHGTVFDQMARLFGSLEL